MAAQLSQIPARGDFIGGRFLSVGDDALSGCIERLSPRCFADVVGRFGFRLAAVGEAVASARAAFPGWARLSLEQRMESMRALKTALAARAEELAVLITREVGKPLWEARTEVAAALNKIDITLSDGLALVTPREMGSSAQRYAFKPHGVAAVLGPFNFPIHLMHGHVVPALVTGNTVVVKPSELSPAVGQLYAECFEAAGLPPGVFNLIQGDASVGAELAAHPEVDAVMLTGSYGAGLAIKRATLEQPHKLLALELGGHNPAIVLADANLDKAVHDVLWGAFVSAGQRCSGTAIALVEHTMFERFSELLSSKLDRLRVGDPLEAVFMGPVVSEIARGRFWEALERAEQQGASALRKSTWPTCELPEGAYLTPSVHLIEQARGLPYETEELFGPDLALMPVRDLEHALSQANAGAYGLSASVFSADRAAFEHALAGLRHGCVNWNAPTCGASSKLPFGGTGKSGNHRPAALFSTLYCTYPVATLEGPTVLDPKTLSPGLTW
ncbi:MAG: aldehyde dehydrogenase family protein [Myxococcales bacterium]